MGKYFLIGIPNCGKSTLGKRVADVMKLPFFDTDDMAINSLDIKDAANMFTSDFGQKFLEAQLSAIIELSKFDGDAIIATGAEVSLRPDCVKYMKAAGKIIHIKRNPELIIEELKNKKTREIIFFDVKNGTKIDAKKDGIKLYMEEFSKYEAIADLYLENNKNEDKGVKKLVKLINMCQREE